MNYLTPRVRLDMQYVLCLYSSLYVISINSFLGCARPNRRQASLGIANQGEYWDFFTIKLPLESADQALFSGLIRLNEA
jgi:hypothetical protein